MAVRRLAPAEMQPASFAFTADNLAWAQTQIAKFPEGRQASAVIPLLWRAQEQNDYWLPKAAIEYVATMLGMPSIRVLEVATFYSMFNLEPVGKYFIQLCGTTPCRLRGAEDIIKVCQSRIGEQKTVTADGLFAWLEVECLGACCNAPMVQINNDYYEDLTPENLNKLLDDLAAGRPVEVGSQTGRDGSAPTGAPASLTEPSLYDGSMIGSWKKRFEEEAAKAAADKIASEKAAKASEASKG
jgi:NADH-quinone oxidoreductase subunit E